MRTLIHKYQGIHGVIWSWIKAFLNSRSQDVVIEGVCSDGGNSYIRFSARTNPQTNPLPGLVKSQVRQFADDITSYCPASQE